MDISFCCAVGSDGNFSGIVEIVKLFFYMRRSQEDIFCWLWSRVQFSFADNRVSGCVSDAEVS